MRYYVYLTQFIWVFFVWFTASCNNHGHDHLPILYTEEIHGDAAVQPETENSFVFRSDVQVFPNVDTLINGQLLAERDGYATIFTDPYGYLWTISTAVGLTDQDFANAGMFMASQTNDGAVFYYGKVNTWEMNADCVVYVAASKNDFVSLRRNQDQGACPTSAGYAAWLPKAKSSTNKNEQGKKSGSLFAYGANNHQDNIVHGEFQGVKVYGNDPYGWNCNDFRLLGDCLAYAGIRLTGAKWDSAELAARYLITKYDHFPISQSPAKYWYQSYLGLKKMANCGSVRPLVGDILLSNGGSHGHAAIVREVSDHSVTIIQQNWFESEKDNRFVLSMTTSGNHYCVSDFGDGYSISGWLRK